MKNDILAKAAVLVEMKPTGFGFQGSGKVLEHGEEYQVCIVAVRIGEEPIERPVYEKLGWWMDDQSKERCQWT